MSEIPSELVANILSRLAVKPLLRFRSVSKPWLALIDSPYFIKLHLNHSIQSNSHQTLIGRDSNHVYSLDLDSLHNPIQLDHPIKCQPHILGSCNGVICLGNSAQGIVLWNPSTQTHHNVPRIQIPAPNCFRCRLYSSYGFGCDHLNDDYKLIRIIQYYDSHSADLFQSLVQVYSLKSTSHQSVSDFPYNIRYKQPYGIFANGALHWVAGGTTKSYKHNMIAAFDLGTEESCLVPLPDSCLGTDFKMNVGALGGCLSLICNFYLRNVDIWVMKDYGIKDSWTKLISVALPNNIRSISTPIAYSKSGEQVLLETVNEGFVWYDLRRKMVETVTVGGLQTSSNPNVCLESLVKLSRGGSGGKNLP